MSKVSSIILAILFVLFLAFVAYLILENQQLPKPTKEQYADSGLGATLTNNKQGKNKYIKDGHIDSIEIGWPPVKILNYYWCRDEKMQIGPRAPLLVREMQVMYPGYSTCEKCGRPWNCCESHVVELGNNRGVFALCDVCWNESSVEEIKKYYTEAYYKYWATDTTIYLKNILDSIAAHPVNRYFYHYPNYR